VTVYGIDEAEVLEKLREQVKIGATLGLWPDSAAVIINGDDLNNKGAVEKKAAKLFNVKLDELGEKVDFEQVEEGVTFHVGVAARYSKAPVAGELLGTLHLHT